MTTKKKTQTRRKFSAEEKLKAVLMIWTEKRSGAEICKQMNLSWALLDRWQNQAMEGMLAALEPKKTEETLQLNSRVEKLLQKKLASRGSYKSLEGRLESLQQKRQSASS